MPISGQMDGQKLEFRDIYDISYDPWWLQNWFFITVGSLIVMALLVGVYVWYRRKQKPALSFADQALQAIIVLEKSDKIQNPQQFYTALTAIVKRYMQQRFSLHFVGLTDDEFLEHLEKQPGIAPEIIEQVKEIFNGVVLIKFAQGQAAQDTMTQSVQNGKNIIALSVEEKEQKK